MKYMVKEMDHKAFVLYLYLSDLTCVRNHFNKGMKRTFFCLLIPVVTLLLNRDITKKGLCNVKVNFSLPYD